MTTSPITTQNNEPTPSQKFIQKLPRNAGLAFMTVPIEKLAVDRILFLLDNPENKPSCYFDRVKKLKIKKLFAGYGSRVSYVLAGNLASVKGIEVFGPDFKGLFLTSVFKNIVLPLSLLSNARQKQMDWKKTGTFVWNGFFNRGCHWSFFWRNLLSNYCLIPGFYVEKKCYEALDKQYGLAASIAGLTVSGSLSGIMNTALKPFYTGKYPPDIRRKVAVWLPSLLPVTLRESVSHSLIFASSTAEKRSKNLE